MQPQLLADLASAVADGLPVDWDAMESSAKTPAERSVITQLRVLSSVSSVAQTPNWLDAESSDTQPPLSPADEVGSIAGDATKTADHATWRHLILLERVGQGGFGTVFRAWDSQLDTEVALKLIPAGTVASVIDVATGGEGRLLARVRHPNVVTIHGADLAEGKFGLWMEFVHGRTLRQIVEGQGPFGPQEALTMGAEVARALAAVHTSGLVHRDVKAQNVIREDGGRLVLMDFGAGEDLRSASPRKSTGTPVYMAPELFEGQRATAKTDIYSLGVLLFYLVTGKYPVSGRTWAEVGDAHRSGRRQLLRDLRPDLPAAFVECIESLIAPDHSQRVQTAGAAEAALQRARGTRSERRWGLLAAAATLAVVGALAVGANLDRLRGLFWGASGVRTIAVLPMANLSGDAGRDYFVDGMTDQLIAELSRIPALRVTDRTSVMGYKQTTKRLNEIAGELGVDAVLEASIVLAGSELRLTAALIRAGDGLRLWSKSYERSVKDAFALQAELTRDLASSISVALTPEQNRALAQPFVPNPQAFDLYLKGRALLWGPQRASILEACSMLEQATVIEPNYALAWAGLSRCYSMIEPLAMRAPVAAGPKAKEAAIRALAIDPALSEAHLFLADARFLHDRDWSGAAESYVEAVRLNPSLSIARGNYARFLAAGGQTDEAVEHARRGVEIDPHAVDTRRTLALMLFYQRHYAEALERADAAIGMNDSYPSSHVIRARALTELFRYDEALQAIQRARSLLDSPAQLAEHGRILALMGRRDEALAILEQLPRAAGVNGLVHSEDAATILTALGRYDEALSALEHAVQQRSSRVLWLRVDPRVDPLRQHPRFHALLAEIGGLD